MFGHLGGAPVEEVVLVLIPVSGLAALLYFANRRANRALDARADTETSDPDAADLTDAPHRPPTT